MNNSHSSFTGTGILTLLTVLLVLVLSVFSVLTFASSQADSSLSRANADMVSSYYQADTKAMRLVQEFMLGSDTEFTAQVPVTDRQALSIHVVRTDQASFEILSWNVVSTSEEAIIID